MADVIIDTNMFLSVIELKLDIITLIQEHGTPGTLDLVLNELDKPGAKYAYARKMAETVRILPYDGTETAVDAALIDYCERHNCILVSQDAALISLAKRKHLKTLGIRQKKYLY